MPNSSDQDYTWTFSDVRQLDARLSQIESKLDAVQKELVSRSHVVVDNTNNNKDKVMVYVAIAISVVFTFIYVLNQLGVFK